MLENLGKIIREHKLILANALLMALLMVAPLIAFPLMTRDSYQGINIANHGFDELWYLSRARDALDGHHLGNALFREGKNLPDPYFTAMEQAIFAPFRVLGLANKIDVTTVYAILNVVGVFILVLLIYWFVFQLSANKFLAAISALLAIGGYALATPGLLFSINVYSRAMTPFIPSLFTFLYLNFLFKVIKLRSGKYIIAASLVLGGLFYIYFYAWSFIIALNIILAFLYGIKKDYIRVKRLLIVTGLGLLLGAYNLYNLFSVRGTELGRELDYFHWVTYGHLPVFSAIGFAALLLLGAGWSKIKSDNNFLLLLAFILAGWAVLNQHVITGKLLQFGHYYQYFVVPTSFIVCTYIIWMLLRREAYRRIFLVLAVLFAYLNVSVGQYRAVLTNYEAKQYRQQYRPIVDYLKKAADPGVILTADDANAYLVTIYTGHDIFWARSYLVVNVPIEERLRDTLFIYLYLNKESRGDIASYLRAVLPADNQPSFYRTIYETLEGYSSGLTYYDYFDKVAAKDPIILSQREDLIKSLTSEYDSLLKDEDGVPGLLKKYGVTYIIWDKNKYPEWDISFLNIDKVVTSGTISLYKINL